MQANSALEFLAPAQFHGGADKNASDAAKFWGIKKQLGAIPRRIFDKVDIDEMLPSLLGYPTSFAH